MQERGLLNTRRTHILGMSIFVLSTVLRLTMIERQGLWTDELFSLAMATGHGLEHPADQAESAHGDYIEAPGPVASSQSAEMSRARSGAGRSSSCDPCCAPQRYESAALLPHCLAMSTRVGHGRWGVAAVVDTARTRMFSVVVEAGEAL